MSDSLLIVAIYVSSSGVERNVQKSWIKSGTKNVLSAVAVVDVKIYDTDASKAEAALRQRCCRIQRSARSSVEQAKSVAYGVH